MQVLKLVHNDQYWKVLIDYAKNCSWAAGKHLSEMMENNTFSDFESVFVTIEDNQIVGFCTFLKTDYYPENRYLPWISTIFVDEKYRGHRYSQQMIEFVIEYARTCHFSRVYIPSDMLGFYEKYGFKKIDELENYSGDIDHIFMKEI